jgi:RNA polymerase sigma factor (sigma-70 family)
LTNASQTRIRRQALAIGICVKKHFINDLYLKAKTDNQIAEGKLFDELAARFQLIVENKIWNRQDASELSQDALMTVFAKYRTSEFKSTFADWAFRILHNKMLHYFRTKANQSKRELLSENPEMLSSGWQSDPELEMRILRCVKKIIKKNIQYARSLVHAYQGYTANEICTKMNTNKSNFYAILSRARSLLKYCIKTGEIK